VDASDGIFLFFGGGGFYKRFCRKVEKSSKVGHPNYFSSHIFWINNLEGMRGVRHVPHWRRWKRSYSDISEEETIWKT
jgi:hypothetical protein